jgi:hypothetical protein
MLRGQAKNFAIRDSIVQALAKTPQPADRELFAAALESPQPEIAETAASALKMLTIEPHDNAS